MVFNHLSTQTRKLLHIMKAHLIMFVIVVVAVIAAGYVEKKIMKTA